MVDLGNSNYAIRTILYVTNGKQYKLQEEFLSAYVQTLTKTVLVFPIIQLVYVVIKRSSLHDKFME